MALLRQFLYAVSRIKAFAPPELLELLRVEVREHLAVHLDDWRECLAGKLHHFFHRHWMENDVQFFVSKAALIEPAHGIMAPRAVWLDEKADSIWFHCNDVPVCEVV